MLLINMRLHHVFLLPLAFFSTLSPLLNSHLGDANRFILLVIFYFYINNFILCVLRITSRSLLLFCVFIHGVTPFLESFIFKKSEIWVFPRLFHQFFFLFWAHHTIFFQKCILHVESITRLVKFLLLLFLSESLLGFFIIHGRILRLFNTFSTYLVNWVILIGFNWSFVASFHLISLKIWRNSTLSSCATMIAISSLSSSDSWKRWPSLERLNLLTGQLHYIKVDFMLRSLQISSILKFDQLIDFLHTQDPVRSVLTLRRSSNSPRFAYLMTTSVVIYPHRNEHTFC